MDLVFTGVGGRATPYHVLLWMQEIALRLSRLGYRLRSGGAEGADQAFQYGRDLYLPMEQTLEIYLPWDGFEGLHPMPGIIDTPKHPLYAQAAEIAKALHPVWDEKLTRGMRSMHTRNVFQILGDDLASPSRFAVFWAPPRKDGTVKGGTNTAVQLAKQHGVPTINLHDMATFDEAWAAIEPLLAA